MSDDTNTSTDTIWDKHQSTMKILGRDLSSEVKKAHASARGLADESQKAEFGKLKPGETVPRHAEFTIVGDEYRAIATRSYNERWKAIKDVCDRARETICPNIGEGPDQGCAVALSLLQLRPKSEVTPEEVSGLMKTYGSTNYIAAKSIASFANGLGWTVHSELLDALTAVDRCENDATKRAFSVLTQKPTGEGESERDANGKTDYIVNAINKVCGSGTNTFFGTPTTPSEWAK